MDVLTQINWFAVLAASVAGFATGAVWYGVFAKPWMAAIGKNPDDLTQSAGLYMGAFALQVVMAIGLAVVIVAADITTWSGGAVMGAVLGLALVTANKALNAGFQGVTMKLVLIDGLHAATAFLFMGAILGAWR